MTWENMTNRFQNGPQPPQDLASREFIAVLLFDEWHPLDLSLRFASFRHGTVALHELPVLQLSGCWAQSGSVSFVLGRREESDRLPQVATRAFLRFEMDDLHMNCQ